MVTESRDTLRKRVAELEAVSGRGSSMVTLYVPPTANLGSVQARMRSEESSASNIKSKLTRDSVCGALGKIVRYLSSIPNIPENGLAIFSADELVIIEPPEPIARQDYSCGRGFDLKELREILVPKSSIGMILIERSGATIGSVSGKNVTVLKEMDSCVPGKFASGGQSHNRFENVIQGLLNDFFKKVGEITEPMLSGCDYILVGGPGPTKTEFVSSRYLRSLSGKVVDVQDIGSSGESGLRELFDKCRDRLQETEAGKEIALVREFLGRLATGKPVEYGRDAVIEALQNRSVDTLLLSEDVEVEGIDDLATMGNAKVMRISTGTQEGRQFEALGGIGAILRW